jgi:tetratricopeptide (TPR) repeat protein/tRNA A-37 threonylcarbamoyl transferase component Bud32
MTPQRWAQIKELFERAMELDASERARFAEQACAGDEELRREVQRLLDDDIEAESFLSNPPVPAYQPCSWPAGKIILGRFRIIRFVGRGGMGEVYEAQDLALNQRVALKTILPEVARDSRISARFKQEITLARKVTDPHVSRIYELFTDSAPFLTMEFLEGVTLSKKIRSQGSLPEAEARVIALQLCQALDAAHRAGVVHRDFKSGNIMVSTRDGEPWAVVTDFGLATMMVLPEAETVTGALTRPGAIIGTTPYMAPEQLEGGTVAPATDLYALGIVLYEMLTGRTPFPSATPVAAAMERLKNQPDPPSSVVPGLSPVWDGVIKHCLEYDVARRPQSAAEVAGRLSSGQGPATTRQKWRTSRRGVGAVIVGLLVLAVTLAGWTRWGNTYRPPSRDAQNRYDEGTAALHEGTYLKAARALERAVMFDKNFVLAHARLADAYTELEYTDKAKDEMVQASSLEFLKNLPQIDKDYVEAVRATIARDFPAAVERYQRILKVLPSSGKAFGLVDLGRAYEKAGQDQFAIKEYASAAANSGEYPAAFLRLGILYGRLDNKSDADSAFKRAESLYRFSSNLEGQAEVNYQRGVASVNRGELLKAKASIEQAIVAADAIPSPQLEMRALLQLSGIDYRIGDIEQAKRNAQTAVDLARDNGIGLFWWVQGLVLLGNTCLHSGEYAKAESYYQEALALARKNGSLRLQAMPMLSLASLRDKQGRPDDVIPLADRAQQYYEQHGFVANANSALTLLARAHQAKGDIQGALEAFGKQAALGRKAGNAVILSDAEEGLGSVYEQIERFPEALAHYRAALESGNGRGPGFTGYQAVHCAGVLTSLGQYAEAASMLDVARSGVKAESELPAEIEDVQAVSALSKGQNSIARTHCERALSSKIPITPETQVQLLSVRGLAQVRSGSVKHGLEDCRAALKQAMEQAKTGVPAASLSLAEGLFRSDSLQEARSRTQDALAMFHAVGQRDSEWRSLLLLGLIARHSGDVSAAREFASKAMDILDGIDHNWMSQDSNSYRCRPDVQRARSQLAILMHLN